jgi:DNA replication protein DnaC
VPHQFSWIDQRLVCDGHVEGEAAARQDRAVLRRVKAARFPVIKTLDTFRWDWPKKINRLQIQDLFRLSFIDNKANVIFLGLCGLGKSHLANASVIAHIDTR